MHIYEMHEIVCYEKHISDAEDIISKSYFMPYCDEKNILRNVLSVKQHANGFIVQTLDGVTHQFPIGAYSYKIEKYPYMDNYYEAVELKNKDFSSGYCDIKNPYFQMKSENMTIDDVKKLLIADNEKYKQNLIKLANGRMTKAEKLKQEREKIKERAREIGVDLKTMNKIISQEKREAVNK